MKCPNCKAPNKELAVRCEFCGSDLSRVENAGGGNAGASSININIGGLNNKDRIGPSNPPRDPLLVALLGGCCIGPLAYLLIGQTQKCIALVFGAVFLAFAGFIGVLPFWLFCAVDGYMQAQKLKEGKTIGQWEFF